MKMCQAFPYSDFKLLNITLFNNHFTKMKDILALIKEKQKFYARSPLFCFMQDRTIHPLKRLAFVPCSAPFILGFTDLCKYGFCQEPTNNKIQSILNQHAHEDGNHWKWFIEDMESLGFNCQLAMNDALNFLWHEETKISRLVTYELYKYIAEGTEIEKLIILESIEGVADIFLSSTKKVTDELQLITNKEYKYFGGLHVAAEQEHEAHSDDMHEYIQTLCITAENRQHSVYLVEKVFELFDRWNQGLLTYAKAYAQHQPLERQLEYRQVLKAV
jgi:hypothetical protein